MEPKKQDSKEEQCNGYPRGIDGWIIYVKSRMKRVREAKSRMVAIVRTG